MTQKTTLILPIALALVLACQLDTEAAYQDYIDSSGDDSSDTFDDAGDASTTDDFEPIATSTSGPSVPPTGDAPQGGPEILGFTVDPATANEAGPVSILVEHTPDVAAVMLFDIYDGETRLLAELGPDEPWTYAITSEADFEGIHELHAIVVDDQDRWAEAATELTVDLPPGGSMIWINEGEGDQSTLNFSLAAAAVESGVVVAGIDLNAGSGHAFARLYAGNTGDLMWSYEAPKGVYISDVEGTPDGGVVLVGHIELNDTRQAWVHQLGPDGAPALPSPIEWLTNTTAIAVAVDDDGGLYVTGEVIQVGMFEHTDIFVWHLPAEGQGMPAWAMWGTDVGNTLDDHASSITITDDHRVFVGGSTKVATGNNTFADRMAVFEYSNVDILLRWVADGGTTEESDGLGVAMLEDDVVIAGWQRLSLNDPQTMTAVRLHETSQGASLYPVWSYPAGASLDGQLVDIKRDPNDRVVVVASEPGTPDRLTTIALRASGYPAWTEDWVHFGNGDTTASSVAVDEYGYVYFVGTTAANGVFRTLVGKRRP
ncbi:MAG: hypothetical protein H6834_18675 [Planctomycetes bacterium]|nr:hypothetical protein [Myxococcales bacterium]MCB9883820.1 hypothetical protein [Planctomycetota bacterium]